MRILLNSYNTRSAGTGNISANLGRYLESARAPDDTIMVLPDLPLFSSLTDGATARFVRWPVRTHGQFIQRIWAEAAGFPSIRRRFRPDVEVVVANYALIPTRIPRIVLVRHPYLVDDGLFQAAGPGVRVREALRRLYFRGTVRTADMLVVQSDYMADALRAKYTLGARPLRVLPNPVAGALKADTPHAAFEGVANPVIYVSRYYEHKNHDFLLDVAGARREIWREKGVVFFVTVNPGLGPGAARFVERIRNDDLKDVVVNLGERPQEELGGLYLGAVCQLFPSRSETFGNPIVEALGFGVPNVVPDLPYARAICGDAGVYFPEGAVEDAAERICSLVQDSAHREKRAADSKKMYERFPSMGEWWEILRGYVEEITSG